MQGKDLDKLFQSALDDYEVAPSAKVWAGIAEELNAGKRKKAWIPFLSAAAGIVLLITAGLLFIPKEVKVIKPKADGIAKTKQVVPQTATDVQQANQTSKKPHQVAAAPATSLAANKLNHTHTPAGAAKPAIAQVPDEAVKPADQPVLASATNKQEVRIPVLPDTTTKIVVKHIDETPVFASIKPPVAPVQLITAKQTPPVKKRRIRSLGDVFNVVIAAVDKRKDKFIEFSNTDEDDATITGVNLGILKIKKEK